MSADYFNASVIARAAGTYAKAVRRQATREGWLVRLQGTRLRYSPPKNLRKRCRTLAAKLKLIDQPRAYRELARASAVLAVVVRMKVQPALGFEAALLAVADDFGEILEFSPITLRRWFRAVEVRGLAALSDRRPGRSGRKKKGSFQ